MLIDPKVSTLLDEMGSRLPGAGDGTPQPEATPLRRVLGMRVGGELYGANIENITNISKLTPITFVPGAPRYILGVTSLAGQIVPVVNLRLVLNTDAGAAAPGAAPDPALPGAGSLQAKPRVVVVHHEDTTAGLLVDAVTEVYDLRTPVETLLGGAARGPQVKEGYVTLSGRILILLHVPSLFARLMGST